MADYKRTLTLDPEKQYWYVDMGRLDRINGPGRYPFPTEAAAMRFAKNIHRPRPPQNVARHYHGREQTMDSGEKYEVISLYDSRIIKRDLTENDARELVRHLNRNTDHGAKVKRQNY